MPSFFSKLHHHIKKHNCNTGECQDLKNQQKKNQKNNNIYDTFNKHKNLKMGLDSPSSFYTTGIYGTNNCNSYNNGIPKISKFNLALESVGPVLSSGKAPAKIKTHLNNHCPLIENFYNNIEKKIKCNNIILGILFILILISLICYIYYYKIYIK